jgi:metal-sulfur cluster biosynthetic enzyme
MDRTVLIDALRDVYDPCCADRGVSIVDMGVVEDVRARDGHVEVDLIPTTGWCPFVANMSAAIPEALKALPGVHTVDVKVVWEPAWTPDRLSESARAQLMLPLAELEPLRAARSVA